QHTVLSPVNMHAALVQLDLVPLEIAYLAGAQPVPICNQHHGGVAVAMPILASVVHKPLHLSLGQVAALNCQVLDRWRRVLDSRFHRHYLPFSRGDCREYIHFLHSVHSPGYSLAGLFQGAGMPEIASHPAPAAALLLSRNTVPIGDVCNHDPWSAVPRGK